VIYSPGIATDAWSVFMDVLQAFSKAKEHNGTWRPYSQGFFKWHQDPKDTSGACYGLSLFWMISRKNNSSLFDLVGEEVEAVEGEEQKFQQLEKKRHQLGALTNQLNRLTQSAGDDKLALDAARSEQNKILAKVRIQQKIDGSKPLITTIKGVDLQFQEGKELPRENALVILRQKTAEAITKYGDCWVLIHIPNHTMVAQLLHDKRLTFFDPNGGEAQFANSKNFEEWFQSCWAAIDGYSDVFSFIIEYYII
ncbi:MAG: YopT-type cysteine protease domain-containing protein, partial [Bryobacteraceae bacterium]